jgi:hypothetical protein
MIAVDHGFKVFRHKPLRPRKARHDPSKQFKERKQKGRSQVTSARDESTSKCNQQPVLYLTQLALVITGQSTSDPKRTPTIEEFLGAWSTPSCKAASTTHAEVIECITVVPLRLSSPQKKSIGILSCLHVYPEEICMRLQHVIDDGIEPASFLLQILELFQTISFSDLGED